MRSSRFTAVLVGLLVPISPACASAANNLAAQMVVDAPRPQAPPSFNRAGLSLA